MTQEQKDLLLKDLSSRLLYGVKCQFEDTIEIIKDIWFCEDDGWQVDGEKTSTCIHAVKPYLFPLSSMTEEQKKEISKRYNLHTSYGLCIEITNHSEGYWDNDNSCHLQDYLWLIDWFNRNHFDYRGLINKGLANDATNLNIY